MQVSDELTIHGGKKIILVEPRLFMNESGKAAKECCKKFNVKPVQLLVVHDDIDRALGKVSVKYGGSAQGQNGVKSVIGFLGCDSFTRIRVGIGRPAQRDHVSNYVLENFEYEEKDKIPFEKVIRKIENICVSSNDD